MSFFQDKLRKSPSKLSENQELILERIKSREKRVQEAKNTLSNVFENFRKEKKKEITEISGPFKVNEVDHYILVAFKRKFLGRKGKLTRIKMVKNDGEIVKEEETAKKILLTSLFQALIQNFPVHMIIRDELNKDLFFIKKFSSLIENGHLIIHMGQEIINITLSHELLNPEEEKQFMVEICKNFHSSVDNLLSSIAEYSEVIEKLSDLEINILSDPSDEDINKWLKLKGEQISMVENLEKNRNDYISSSKKVLEKISTSENIYLINKIFENSKSFLDQIENASHGLSNFIIQTNQVVENALMPLWQR